MFSTIQASTTVLTYLYKVLTNNLWSNDPDSQPVSAWAPVMNKGRSDGPEGGS